MSYTPTQNLILTALRGPVEFPCSSRKEAEQRKFFILNQKKAWTRSADAGTRAFAKYFESIEVVIRLRGTSSWSCIVRPKGWDLHAMLASAGLRPDGTRHEESLPSEPTTPAPEGRFSYTDIPLPTPIHQIDPTSDEGTHLQLLMDVDDWLAHMADNVKFPHTEADDLRRKIARGELPRPTLQAFKDMVQDIAMRKAYKVPTPH